VRSAFLFVIIFLGCSTDPEPDPVVYVEADVLALCSDSYVIIYLKSGGSSGSVITGAAVTVNGQTIPESGEAGTYIEAFTDLFTESTVMNLSVAALEGTVTGSAVMPAAAVVTSPETGFLSSVGFIASWAGPGPDSSTIWANGNATWTGYDHYPRIPSPATSYTADGSKITAMSTTEIFITADMRGSLNNAVAGSFFISGNCTASVSVQVLP